MTTIGSFTRTANGYAGTLKTLTLEVKVRFVPEAKDKEAAPDYRLLAPSSTHPALARVPRAGWAAPG